MISGINLSHFSVLFIEARSLNQSQSSPMWLVFQATLLWGFCLYFLRLELQAGHHAHPVFMWVVDLNSGPHVSMANTEQSSRPLLNFLIPLVGMQINEFHCSMHTFTTLCPLPSPLCLLVSLCSFLFQSTEYFSSFPPNSAHCSVTFMGLSLCP